MNIYCIWNGFVWVWKEWDEDELRKISAWRIDPGKSGGPPSSHEEAIEPPPVSISFQDSNAYLRLETAK